MTCMDNLIFAAADTTGDLKVGKGTGGTSAASWSCTVGSFATTKSTSCR